MSVDTKSLDALSLLHNLKLLVFETGLTIVFITWVVREVRHQLTSHKHEKRNNRHKPT
ncbi:MAG: hypothetical protein JNK87_07485 [Bryobacterales bacterium]|nr:hypothetical protein [Bryobacterales bacterium]